MTKQFSSFCAPLCLGLALSLPACADTDSGTNDAELRAEDEIAAQEAFEDALAAFAEERGEHDDAGLVEAEDMAVAAHPSEAGGCIPPAPLSNGFFPVGVPGWQGSLTPDLNANQVEIRNANGSLLGVFPMSNYSSNCPFGTNSGVAVFRVVGAGRDNNTWVRLDTWGGFRYHNQVQWEGLVYSTIR